MWSRVDTSTRDATDSLSISLSLNLNERTRYHLDMKWSVECELHSQFARERVNAKRAVRPVARGAAHADTRERVHHERCER